MNEHSPLPYLPSGRTILYVSQENEFMKQAQDVAKNVSLDPGHPTGVVLVKNGSVIGRGANGSRFHRSVGCLRKFFHAKTGKMYWLCPGCSPYYHAEQKAIRNALRNGQDPKGADLYLWGHWWCCESCWKKMMEAEIANVYLLDTAQEQWKR